MSFITHFTRSGTGKLLPYTLLHRSSPHYALHNGIDDSIIYVPVALWSDNWGIHTEARVAEFTDGHAMWSQITIHTSVRVMSICHCVQTPIDLRGTSTVS